MKPKKKRTYRAITFLNREELDFLDEIAKDIYFKYGLNIPRTKLIEEIIDSFKDKNKEEVEKELMEKFQKESKDSPESCKVQGKKTESRQLKADSRKHKAEGKQKRGEL